MCEERRRGRHAYLGGGVIFSEGGRVQQHRGDFTPRIHFRNAFRARGWGEEDERVQVKIWLSGRQQQKPFVSLFLWLVDTASGMLVLCFSLSGEHRDWSVKPKDSSSKPKAPNSE